MTPRRVSVLPEHIANKIAAGEVVQRPASVVKELLENSIDAGATSVVVSVRDGGRTFIQVADDGCGMDEADARASFLRHATSKIATYEDLESVSTFGFRGEALASIAAVGRVTMKTRRAEDDAAVVVKTEGDSSPEVGREGREPGTTVTVQNLFFNVPARRKFLKSAATEYRHVYEEVQRIAVSRPSLALHFISDGETVFRLKGGSQEARLADVFGERRCEGLLPVEGKGEGVALRGYAGKPAFGLRTRQGQFIFLNGRFIVSRTINAAVFGAYEHLMEKGTFPFFLLFLDVEPRRVDVNVHPSKLEAKFDDEQGIFRFVAAAARRALAAVPAIPALTIQQGGIEPGTVAARFSPRQHSWPGEEGGAHWSFPERPGVDARTGEILPFVPSDRVAEGGALAAGFPPGGEIAASLLQRPEGRADEGGQALIWQLHNKYILSQIRNGLMIVDQHVAHERVLYERALERIAAGARGGQQLLFPATVELSPPDMALLEELSGELDLLGFTIRPFGRNTVVIDGVPPDTRAGGEGKLLEEMLALYKEYRQNEPASVRDNIAKSYSCRSAIKAGDPLSEPEMRSLIDQLFATRMPYVCPHGRPVVLRISIEELDRRFGRTS
ncbi:MAG TPA: DNA mismatch repair endonuclease MutL [Bacteroidota bacterium]|nr:DNA mismatch repair endonuclease MutL [Bacteroidota bacterium]